MLSGGHVLCQHNKEQPPVCPRTKSATVSQALSLCVLPFSKETEKTKAWWLQCGAAPSSSLLPSVGTAVLGSGSDCVLASIPWREKDKTRGEGAETETGEKGLRGSGLWLLWEVKRGSQRRKAPHFRSYRKSSSKAWCRDTRSPWFVILQKGMLCWKRRKTKPR